MSFTFKIFFKKTIAKIYFKYINVKKSLFFISLFLVLAMSCRKETIINTITEEDPFVPVQIPLYEPSFTSVNSSLVGTVVDENQELVEGAMVTLGTSTTTTDRFGIFQFDNREMNQKGTFVEVEKDGYFLTGRRFYPADNQQEVVRIELLPIVYDQSFESDNGGTVAISGDGGSLVFSENSIVDAAGNPYAGTVQVATKWLAPDQASTIEQMPGALMGVNTEAEEVGLSSYGMVGVELRGASGEALNLAEGQTANIELNIPDAMQAAAPAMIPLWSFDYTFGIWMEEGSANKVNGKYVGEVAHFSFWNCDAPFPVIRFDAVIVNQADNQPVPGLQVRITLGKVLSGTGVTNYIGQVGGLIPANSALNLEILSVCGDVLATIPFETTDVDIDLGAIAVSFPLIRVVGNVINCTGELVTNGVVMISINGFVQSFALLTNPFSIDVPGCANTTSIQVLGGDIDAQQQGTFVDAPFGTNIKVGSLEACGEELIGFFRLTIDKVTTRYFKISAARQAPDTITPFVTYIFMNRPDQIAEAPNDTLQASVLFNKITAGDWSDFNGIDFMIDTENGWFLFGDTNEGFTEFIVDEYGPYIGDIVSGYGSGLLRNTYNGNVEIVDAEFSFRAYRSE